MIDAKNNLLDGLPLRERSASPAALTAAVIAAVLGAVFLLGLGAQPARAQITDLQDVLEFTQRAPAVSDARSLGRGGAGRAGIGNATALFYNPAGLGWMSTSAASGALAIIGAQEDARFDGSDPTSRDRNDYGGHFSLAYKVPTARGSLVLAGSYNQVRSFTRAFGFRGGPSSQSVTRQTFLPFDDEYSIDGDFIDWSGSIYPEVAYEGGAIEYFPFENDQGNYPFDPAVLEGTSVDQVGSVGREGRLSEANFGAGVEVAPGVMLGLSANVSFGTYDFSNAYSELDRGGNDDYEVIRNGATYRGLDEVRLEEHFTSDLTGLNLRGGLSAEAVPGVRLGLTVESPTFYQVNETYTGAQVTTFFDDGGRLSSGDLDTFDNDYRVRTPWRFGAGAQLNLLPLTAGVADLTLAADAELVDWSQLHRASDALDLTAAQRENGNYDAVLNTNLGAVYRVAGVALRAGFAYRPDPRAPREDARIDPLTKRVQSDRTSYSLGAGYRFNERFRLDAGWMRERFDDAFAIFPYGSDLAPGATEDVTRDQFLVGVTYSL